MLDRLHTELLHLLPNFTLKDNPYISLGHKGRSSIVTSVFGGTLQSEVSIFSSVEYATYLALLKVVGFMLIFMSSCNCLHLKRLTKQASYLLVHNI